MIASLALCELAEDEVALAQVEGEVGRAAAKRLELVVRRGALVEFLAMVACGACVLGFFCCSETAVASATRRCLRLTAELEAFGCARWRRLAEDAAGVRATGERAGAEGRFATAEGPAVLLLGAGSSSSSSSSDSSTATFLRCRDLARADLIVTTSFTLLGEGDVSELTRISGM